MTGCRAGPTSFHGLAFFCNFFERNVTQSSFERPASHNVADTKALRRADVPLKYPRSSGCAVGKFCIAKQTSSVVAAWAAARWEQNGQTRRAFQLTRRRATGDQDNSVWRSPSRRWRPTRPGKYPARTRSQTQGQPPYTNSLETPLALVLHRSGHAADQRGRQRLTPQWRSICHGRGA